MASDREFQSALIALGDLAFDPRVAPHIDRVEQIINFRPICYEPRYRFSTGENLIIDLARALLTMDGYLDFGGLIRTVDDDTWERCFEAIAARRGFERGMHVNPGQRTW